MVKRKGTRKGKKQWRKHVSAEDVEENLRHQTKEALSGGDKSKLDDKQLFFIDKKIDRAEIKRRREAKVSYVDSVLNRVSHVKPVVGKVAVAKGIAHPATTRSKVDKLAKKIQEEGATSVKALADLETFEKTNRKVMNKVREEDRKAGRKPRRKNVPLLAFEKAHEKSLVTPTSGVYDLWGAAIAPKEDSYLEDIDYVKPKTKKREAPIRKIGTAVPVCHAGVSYNPAFDDHQEALAKAVSREVERETKREQMKSKIKYNPEFDKPDLEAADSDEEEEEELGDDEDQANAPTRRLTQADRNKKKRRRAQEDLELTLRKKKEFKKQLNQIPEITKDVKEQLAFEADHLKRKEELADDVKDETKKLGRFKYHEPTSDVLLTEELSGNLRTLKASNKLVNDRFKNMQARNMIETRHVVKRRRRYALKEYEKRDWQDAPNVKKGKKDGLSGRG